MAGLRTNEILTPTCGFGNPGRGSARVQETAFLFTTRQEGWFSRSYLRTEYVSKA